MLEVDDDTFASTEPLASLVLGIHSVSERLGAIVSIPRADGKESVDDRLADALLGFFAFARTVRASSVRSVPANPAPDEVNPAERHAETRMELLR